MRQRLMDALTRQFDHELERGIHRLREGIGPYTRFVRSEGERLAEARQSLRRLREGLLALKERVDASP
jgi:hypothetical protein